MTEVVGEALRDDLIWMRDFCTKRKVYEHREREGAWDDQRS